MSAWHDINDDDIALDLETKEVSIYVTSDDFGSIYANLSFGQIKDVYDKINKENK